MDRYCNIMVKGADMIHGYKDLSWLEGQEVSFERGYSNLTQLEDTTRNPDRVIVLKDYGNTLLTEWIYEYSIYGNTEPRSFKVLIPKSAMAIGDVVMKHADYLTLSRVARYERTRYETN